MKTQRYDETDIAAAAAAIKAGELVAFPTETVYGLGANATLPEAVKKVFEVKGRPTDNPLIVHIADFQQLQQFVDNFHPLTEKLVGNFWPGPLTLIFSIKKGRLPEIVTGGLSTAAFRMPANKKTLELIKTAGVPLVGPSANTSGKPSPTAAEHVYHDLKGKISGIIDDGQTLIGVESTVLDISDPIKAPMILRPGAVTKEALEKVLKTEILIDTHLLKPKEKPKAPGMKYQHYAPDTKVLMVHKKDWQKALDWVRTQHVRAGILAGPTIAEQTRAQTAAVFMYRDDSVEAAAKGLFAGLRALDEPMLGLDVILVEVFAETDLGVAYMNRLSKAANQEYFSTSYE